MATIPQQVDAPLDGKVSKAAVEPPPCVRFGPVPRGNDVGPHGEQPLTVGTIAPSYGLEHVSYGVPVPAVTFCTLQAISARRFETRSQFFAHTPAVIGPRVDLIHSFNHLPLQVPRRRPFVVSCEMELPRILGQPADWQKQFALKALSKESCRRILPLSEAAQRFISRRFKAANHPHLDHKMDVFRGAVTPPAMLRPPRDIKQPIRFLFVGGDGLRKGLGVAVDAVQRLNAGGIEASLTVIGRPTAESYAMPGRSLPTNTLYAVLDETPFIEHHASLPNSEVRRRMAEADFLLFPTVDESLGWVVIEAGLTGLATAATEIFAIPELIDHESSGWLLSTDTDEDGRWLHLATSAAPDEWEALQKGLSDQIVGFAEAIARNPHLPDQMGDAARRKLEALYLPEVAAARLRAIYDAAL
ncbi:MAG: hypothetical protein CML68_25295 [Rhodobacteraceae bacterium]|nr:hypothetical protein [Paracoccaceae bacterium]MBB97903.1 hypothetical protein [Paracoccaceae bacterium]